MCWPCSPGNHTMRIMCRDIIDRRRAIDLTADSSNRRGNGSLAAVAAIVNVRSRYSDMVAVGIAEGAQP